VSEGGLSSNGKPSGLVGQVPAVSKWRDAAPHRHRLRWYLLAEHEAPPVSALNPVVDPDPARIGICCSGGGIRSASFNLGVLQEVQDAGLMQRTEYLAAVSGGSYIASAFAMVAKTHDGGTNDPPGDDSDPHLVRPEAPPFGPGSPEEQYLRNRASYMAPTGAAKALLVWRVLLGLLINLALVAGVITLVAAALSLYYRYRDPGLIRPPPAGAIVGATPDGWVWGLGLGLSAIALIFGALSILLRPRRRGSDFRRFLEVWSLPVFVAGLVIFVLELVVPELIDALRNDSQSEQVRAANSIVTGFSAAVAGIVTAIVVQLRARTADPAKAIDDAKRARGWLASLAPRVRFVVVYGAAWVLGPLLVFGMLVAATMVQVESTRLAVQLGVPLAALVVLFLFSRFADLNSWSLHPFYRHRLCTAFALRRIWREGDPDAGHAEARKEGEFVPLSRTSVIPQVPPYQSGDWPTLIVCAAANVSDPGACPPGRGVTSFTFSAKEMGGPLVGGVETEEFERALSPGRQRDFTLPAVVAMSGAAVSPSMGKMTRSSIRFLLGLANVRLGVWVPNPRRMESFCKLRPTARSDADTLLEKARATVQPASRFTNAERERALEKPVAKKRLMPRPTPRYLLKELLGWTSINDKFLYVTDGGHYENLGLVELLRRGCSRIYCFDASGGKPLSQLGDAIALARSELGVEITFEDEELNALREGDDGVAAKRCATGTIRYTRSTTGLVPPAQQVLGRLVYAPTVMTAGLPWDVHAFKQGDKTFPHHSTFDQLFTDQKFEAYRVLGQYAARSALEAMDTSNVQAAMDGNEPLPSGRRESLRRRVGGWAGKMLAGDPG
jgi:hypothetical protein